MAKQCLAPFDVFPTHVGVDRRRSGRPPRCPSFPHARGGGPSRFGPPRPQVVFSPRTWGWTAGEGLHRPAPRVFPTHVGVDRRPRRKRTTSPRFPHARGGGPPVRPRPASLAKFSPRTWGWTSREAEAPAGSRSFPHARGGGPQLEKGGDKAAQFSPRTWGWTVVAGIPGERVRVFPTHVGVDRCSLLCGSHGGRFPHARGGGPTSELAGAKRVEFSPRTWGWTAAGPGDRGRASFSVPPTHVGGTENEARQRRAYVISPDGGIARRRRGAARPRIDWFQCPAAARRPGLGLHAGAGR